MKQPNNSLIAEKSSAAGAVDPWTPRIHEVNEDGVLIMESFTGDPTCTFGPWPPCGVAGQRVWLSIESPGVAPLKVLVGEKITQGEVHEGVSRALVRSWFEALADDSEIGVVAKVAQCDGQDEITALILPVRNYTVSKRRTVFREEFEVEVTIPRDREHHFGNGLFANSYQGTTEVIKLPSPIPGWGELCLQVKHGGVRFRFGSPASRVDFSYRCPISGAPKGLYGYKEVGGEWAYKSLATVVGDISIESGPGVEGLDFYTDNMHYFDNVIWTTL